jgi:methylenetetrahydrofolate reductase (NADPH)
MTTSGTQASGTVQRGGSVASHRRLLADPHFELMPFDSIEEQTAHLPDDATITITASPTLGLEDTITWSENLAEDGYEVVPHVAARYVEDEAHLAEIAGRLTDVGVTDIFVPGGDREEPVGEFDSAYQLLTALEDLDYSFDDVGITGYPEGHDFLDDEVLAESMQRKAPYATYITTQICYDPDAIIEWAADVEQRGIDLPIQVGIPGVMKYQRLLGISRKVGVGDSVKFLKKTTGILDFVKQFVGSRGKYTPDDLVEGVAPYADDPNSNIRGLHIYTFNQVPDTESWRHDTLDGN